VREGEGTFVADARLPVEEFEEAFAKFSPRKKRSRFEYASALRGVVGGAGPGRGEIIAHAAGVEFEVLDADPRRLKRCGSGGPGTHPRRAGGPLAER